MNGEDHGAPGPDPADDWGDDAGRDEMLGWISPDDRLWRHPSESGKPTSGASTLRSDESGPPSRVRSGPWIVGGTTACIVLALVAAGLVVANTGTADQDSAPSTPGAGSLTAAPTTEPGFKQAIGLASITAAVSSIRQSTVVLKIQKSSGTSVTTGLVAESGGIIVTTSEALSGARVITVIEPSGSHETADLIGTDQATGLAVVRIGDDLPAAIFNSADPATGSGAIAIALEPARQSDASPSPVVYAGSVLSSGQAMGADPITTRFAATALVAPLSHDDLGCPLVDGHGHVSGLLEKTVQDGASTVSVFLPAGLVLGVTRQLVSSGAVIHGWLGVHTSEGTDTSATTTSVGATAASIMPGARLAAIDSGSPAAASDLEPGDIITGIDGDRVQSSAELQTRLYPDPPGSAIVIGFLRGGVAMKASVVLASASADAQAGRSSP